MKPMGYSSLKTGSGVKPVSSLLSPYGGAKGLIPRWTRVFGADAFDLVMDSLVLVADERFDTERRFSGFNRDYLQ